MSFDAAVRVSGVTGDAATRGAIHPEAVGTAIAAEARGAVLPFSSARDGQSRAAGAWCRGQQGWDEGGAKQASAGHSATMAINPTSNATVTAVRIATSIIRR
jgi:hypothetical protein